MFTEQISQAITAWSTIALVLVTAIGFGFVAWQAAEIRTTITDDALNTLYNQYTELLSLLHTKPHLYPYVYNNAALSEKDIQEYPALRAEMNIICETVLALIEHALMYDRRLPNDAWNNCWRPYAEERFMKSKELRQFFKGNESWYAQSLRDFYATIQPNFPVDEQPLAARSQSATMQVIKSGRLARTGELTPENRG
jgi:hypothetical protein